RARSRRDVERRLASLRDRRADRTARGVLHRLLRTPAGIRVDGEARISVSGAALHVAEAAARNAGAASPAAAPRRLPAESRSDREHRTRRAHRSPLQPPPRARDDGAPAAAAGVPDAVSGTGIRIVE